MLSGRVLRRADHSYRAVLPSECVCIQCDCQASIMRAPWPKEDVAPLRKIAKSDSFRNLLIGADSANGNCLFQRFANTALSGSQRSQTRITSLQTHPTW